MARTFIFLITTFQIHVASASAAVLLFDDFDGASGGVPPGWVNQPTGAGGMVEDLAGSVVRITGGSSMESIASFDPSSGVSVQATFTSITSVVFVSLYSPNIPTFTDVAFVSLTDTGLMTFDHDSMSTIIGSTTYSGGAITLTMTLDDDSVRVTTDTGFNTDILYSSLAPPFALSDLGSSVTVALEAMGSSEIVVDRVSVSSLEFGTVPEPSTAGLLAFGLSMLACRRRRRVISAGSP